MSKRLLLSIITIFAIAINCSAQWAINNFRTYLADGDHHEYIQRSTEELNSLTGTQRKAVYNVIELYKMLSQQQNNQLDIENFNIAVNSLNLSVSKTSLKPNLSLGKIYLDGKYYIILLNYSDEMLRTVGLKGAYNAGTTMSTTTIQGGAWNYCAKLLTTSEYPYNYSLIDFNETKALSSRPLRNR